jgi:hypothetical protein
MLALLHPDVTFEKRRRRRGDRVRQRARRVPGAGRSSAATLFREPPPDRPRVPFHGATARRWTSTTRACSPPTSGPELRAGATLRLAGRSAFAIRDGRIARIVDES